jgi:hypothetical protein
MPGCRDTDGCDAHTNFADELACLKANNFGMKGDI